MLRLALMMAVLAAGFSASADDAYLGAPPLGAPAANEIRSGEAPLPQRLPPADMFRPPVPGSGAIAPFQSLAYPSRAAAADSGALQPEVPLLIDRPIQSSWYARIDYFHWNERVDAADFVNESGPLATLGYVRRYGRERYRFEFFGGSVHYDGAAVFDDGTSEPLSSSTNYLGVRGEYDFLIEPSHWENVRFLVGMGTRFWVRDLPDDVTASGGSVTGYQETWWTIYPYLGMETKHPLRERLEFYSSLRVGATPITYQHVSLDDTVLYPKCGVLGQVELGLRSPRLFLAGAFEAMTWRQSAIVRDDYQPNSTLITVGLKAGLSF